MTSRLPEVSLPTNLFCHSARWLSAHSHAFIPHAPHPPGGRDCHRGPRTGRGVRPRQGALRWGRRQGRGQVPGGARGGGLSFLSGEISEEVARVQTGPCVMHSFVWAPRHSRLPPKRRETAEVTHAHSRTGSRGRAGGETPPTGAGARGDLQEGHGEGQAGVGPGLGWSCPAGSRTR